VRSASDESAEQVTQLLPGEPLEVVASEDAWARVVTVYVYPGWVLASALEEREGRGLFRATPGIRTQWRSRSTTGREGVACVVAEPEPDALLRRRRGFRRL
jgi:SH3-like domain-containing protein